MNTKELSTMHFNATQIKGMIQTILDSLVRLLAQDDILEDITQHLDTIDEEIGSANDELKTVESACADAQQRMRGIERAVNELREIVVRKEQSNA